MTCSADSSPPRRALKEALNRPMAPIRFPRPHLEIEAPAKRLERINVPLTPIPPRPNVLEETEKRLITGRGNLANLELRHGKAIPYILWTSSQGWSNNAPFITSYLAWADQNWPTAPRRLWRHYLLNMDPASPATQQLSRWLAARTHNLPPALLDFSEKWRLFQPEQAIRQLADALLAGCDIVQDQDIEKLRIGRPTLLESAFLLSVLQALGQRLQIYEERSGIVETLQMLLKDLGKTPLNRMHGPAGLHQSALKSLVEGLIDWAKRQDVNTIDQTLNLLDLLIGDPRLEPLRWSDINPAKREIVERWLTKITLDAFFQVMRAFTTERHDMVEEREQFWRGYEQTITRAWLVTANAGREIAHKLLGQSFGIFSGGRSTRSDHLALMLQMGNYVIFEMNQTGRTLFWPVNDPQMPGFFQFSYSRSEMKDKCPEYAQSATGRFWLRHPHGWQGTYRNTLRELGIYPNQ